MLVERMGGQIVLDKSEEGKGSTFSFTLPVASKQQLKEVRTDAQLQLPIAPRDNCEGGEGLKQGRECRLDFVGGSNKQQINTKKPLSKRFFCR
jgi:hypothetical protein